MHFNRFGRCKVFAGLTLAIALSSSAFCDVVIDGSLGGMPRAVMPGSGFDYDIQQADGQTRGSNLFHSFDQFDIDFGEHANFSGANAINNIIARVTGGESSIAGRVSSDITGASLWLVNPDGFLFSNGAVVDVDGSFNLSTADFLDFSDGSRIFSRLGGTSTLTTAEVSSFGFVSGGVGDIGFDSRRVMPGESAGEDKTPGQNLNVNSEFIQIGDADITASNIGFRMGDAGFGEIVIEDSVVEAVEGVVVFQGGNIYSVDSLVTASGRDSGISVEASSLFIQGDSSQSLFQSGNLQASGGDIDIAAREITLTNSASILSRSGGTREGGNIALVGETIVIEGQSRVDLAAGADSIAGELTIQTQDLLIRDNSELNTSSAFDGATAGAITVNATGQFGLLNSSSLLAESTGTGVGGDISVVADNIVVRGNSDINVRSFGAGDASAVDLKADNFVIVDTGAILNASSSGAGDGGIIQIRGVTVDLDDVDVVGAASGEGAGGDILVEADEINITNGTRINVASFSTEMVAGDAGTVMLNGGDVTISNGVSFELQSFGGGLGGNLAITADALVLDDVEVKAEVRGAGFGGDVVMSADSIIWNEVTIDASVEGAGRGGFIQLQSENTSITDSNVNITASGIGDAGDFMASGGAFSFVSASNPMSGVIGDASGEGRGADIFIDTDTVQIDGILLTSATRGSGEGGVIEIRGEQSIALNDATLSSQSEGSGIGGNVDLVTGDLSLTGVSAINVSALGTADAGDITATATTVTLEDSAAFVLAARGTGSGGFLNVTGETVIFSDSARVAASVEFEASGDLVEFNTDTLVFENTSRVASDTRGAGTGGVIDIATRQLVIRDNASLNAEALSTGDAGLIKIVADDVLIAGGKIITTTMGSGVGGDVDVSAQQLSITQEGVISSDSLSSGDGGDIEVSSVSFQLTNASINAVARGAGVGGLISLQGDQIDITNEALINVSAITGTGDAGEISIVGSNVILASNSAIALSTFTDGDAGVLTIQGDTLLVENARIQGETHGLGAGSDILLIATEIDLENSLLNSAARGTEGMSDATGNAGDLRIETADLDINGGAILLATQTDGAGGELNVNATTFLMRNEAVITASAFGDGDAGIVTISTQTANITEASTIESDTTGLGTGGDVLLAATKLNVLTNSTISSSATGLADAGDITLLVSDTLEIVEGTVQTTSERSGGGNIVIETEKVIRIDNNSLVSATASGVQLDSDGGNVSIDPELFTLRQSQIVAQANAGTGGNITLVAENFIADTESLISASSQRGIDGSVEIESPNQAINPSDIVLNTGFRDLPEFLSNNCSPTSIQDRSYLVVENMNAVRRDPNDYLPVLNRQEIDFSLASTNVWHKGC